MDHMCQAAHLLSQDLLMELRRSTSDDRSAYASEAPLANPIGVRGNAVVSTSANYCSRAAASQTNKTPLADHQLTLVLPMNLFKSRFESGIHPSREQMMIAPIHVHGCGLES